MAWFNVDDHFHSHPKARRAGLEAIGLWTIAGSHCRAHKSNGFVPEWLVLSWPRGKATAKRLVTAGLWHADEEEGEPGWRFHDWLDIHNDADELEKQRQAARDRQRKRRAKLEELRNGVGNA